LDVKRLELRGDAVPIAEQVQLGAMAGGANGAFTVSDTGVLSYQTGSTRARSELVWFDRSGKQIGKLGEQGDYGDLELSPDGTRAAVSLLDPASRTRDIWLFDVARNLRTRFTFDPADELGSVWSPDGSRVVFNSRRKGQLDLYQKASSGAGGEDVLLSDSLFDKHPTSWSPDARFILYMAFGGTTGTDLWALPLFGDRKPFPFLQTQFNEAAGQFSPDGRWIAYISAQSGRNDVYVAPFPGPGGTWQISTAGGANPRWRRDGKEILYLALDNKLMAAAVNGQSSGFEVGAVRPLFDVRQRPGQRSSFDVSADGQRFLVNTLVEQASSAEITLVVNWTAGLKK
jgi:Tol biopolymer transport system component